MMMMDLTLEVIDGFPEGVDTPMFPESLQEFSPGLDTELKKMVQQLQVTRKQNIVTKITQRCWPALFSAFFR